MINIRSKLRSRDLAAFASPVILDDLSSLEAGGADRNPLGSSVYKGTHRLKVWHPTPLGDIMSVRDVISKHWLFSTNFTALGHFISSSFQNTVP